MPDTREDVVTRATRRAVDLAEKMADRLREELGQQIGSEEVSARHVGDLTERAIEGEEEAFMQVVWLADRQTATPNPVLQVVARKLKEKGL